MISYRAQANLTPRARVATKNVHREVGIAPGKLSLWGRVSTLTFDILRRVGLSRTPLVFEHGERFGYQRRPDVDAA